MPPRSPQLSLTLSSPPRWGGRRLGAGRTPGDRPRSRHATRQRFSTSLPAHVTVRLLPELLSLRTTKVVREIERTFAKGCERSSFRLVHYSLQGNHAHLIVEARDQVALGRGMMAIGSRLARAVNRAMGRTGQVLADRYHAHMLRTPREVRAALRYVLLNARRHAGKASANSGTPPRLDPASSGRWFDGWRQGPKELADDQASSAQREGPVRRAVARARTWLLTTGWRRHGLLDPADVPG